MAPLTLPKYGRQWGPQNLVQLMMVCEYRQMWSADSVVHDKKKSMVRLTEEKGVLGKDSKQVRKLVNEPMIDLLRLVNDLPTRQFRANVRDAIILKLREANFDLEDGQHEADAEESTDPELLEMLK